MIPRASAEGRAAPLETVAPTSLSPRAGLAARPFPQFEESQRMDANLPTDGIVDGFWGAVGHTPLIRLRRAS